MAGTQAQCFDFHGARKPFEKDKNLQGGKKMNGGAKVWYFPDEYLPDLNKAFFPNNCLST